MRMNLDMTALKPHDFAVLLKLVSLVTSVDAIISGSSAWTIESLSKSLLLSGSETHAALKRAAQAGLYDAGHKLIRVTSLREFAIHGVKYAYFAVPGLETRGIPTSIAAPPFDKHFPTPDLPPVWPHPSGLTRGFSFAPLYPGAAQAAVADSDFYELLVIIDALREGGPRVRNIAIEELNLTLDEYSQAKGLA